LLALLSGEFTESFLKEPPRDLASLLDARAVLAEKQVKTDEDSLIALLGRKPKPEGPVDLEQAAKDLAAADYQTRKSATEALADAGEKSRPFLEAAAKADDPEVRLTAQKILRNLKAKSEAKLAQDEGYLCKLLAIRVLEKLRSQKALPELDRIAKRDDVTLADAAAQAMAVIKGQKVPRPSGLESLKEAAALLPADTAFVLVADAERNCKERTAGDLFAEVQKAAGENANAMGFGMPQPEQVLPQINKALATAIAAVGNVRLDSVTIIFSDDLSEDAGYVCLIFKGLCDPARVRRVCKKGFDNERQLGKHTIFFERHGPALCVVDARMVIMTVGPTREGQHMDQVLASIGKRGEAPLPTHIARAFEMVKKGDVRIAASGRLSKVQKDLIKRELAQGGGAGHPVEAAMCKMALKLTEVKLFEAHIEPKGGHVIKAILDDQKKAEELHKCLLEVEKVVSDEMRKHMKHMPPQWKKMLGEEEGKLKFFKSELGDKSITVRINTGGMMGMMGMSFLSVMPMAMELHEDVQVMEEPVEEDF